jgi:hypothetical protein
MFGADAGRECTGEQPPGLASVVSTEDGVPRGCSTRSAANQMVGTRFPTKDHLTAGELIFWARLDLQAGLTAKAKKLLSR